MESIALTCQKCGAALEAAAGDRQVVCTFCSSLLEPVHGPGSTTTRLVEDLRKENADLSRRLEASGIQRRLSDLDREWEEEREEFTGRDQGGRLRRPSRGAVLFVVAVNLVVAIGFFVIAGRVGGEDPFRPSGSRGGLRPLQFAALLPLLLGFVAGLAAWRRLRGYERAEARYRERRAVLEDRLRALEGGA